MGLVKTGPSPREYDPGIVIDEVIAKLEEFIAAATAALTLLSFYGGTPIAKQTGVPVTAQGIHDALVALNLFTA